LDKEGAAPTWKKDYGFHPLGAWCSNTRECLAMLLRPGNAGSNTFTGHQDVLAAAIRQVPARFRRKILVRVDGAGASHELIKHLLALSSPRRKTLFTCGWMITAADEDAIRKVPADAWKPGISQDAAEEDKHVAEITHLMSRAGNWLLAAVQGERHRAGCVVAGERGFGDGPGCERVVCDDTVSVSDKGRPSALSFPEARGGP
jgi:hypothetical protein